VEQELARIASPQHGVVTHVELLDLGMSDAGIQRRLRKGTLIRVHRGVYRVGHTAPSVEARYLAAVKACGEGAVLSGRSAAHLWALLKSSPSEAVEVTAPTERRATGIRSRRRKLHRREVTKVGVIPTTTVPRTLVDLAAELADDELARACHEAGVRYRTAPRQVEAILARRPNTPGAARLRGVISGETKVTLSKLESSFIALLEQHNLPLPQTNRRAGAHRVDCRWPEHHLTVELDSYRFHNSRHAWEQDRIREREAHARGDELRRYTYRDVLEDPRTMLSELRELLGPREEGRSDAGSDRRR
jgi:predicted transcriptional regulator of viral defense system/very-short-patch-repair endonuclease